MARNAEVIVYKPGDLVTFTISYYRGPGIVKRHHFPGSTETSFILSDRIEVVPVGHPNWTPFSLPQVDVELLQRAPE